MIILTVIGALVGLGMLITRTQSGADPATALSLIPVVPPDLEERLVWLPDHPLSDQQREMEPNTRELLTGAYLRAWAQWGISLEIGQPYGLSSYFSGPALAGVTRNVTETVASGWTIRQSNLHHEITLHYYSDDGSIVSFTDTNLHLVQQFLHTTTGETDRPDVDTGVAAEGYVLESDHRYDVVMLLEDGNWQIYQWLRLGGARPTVEGPWPVEQRMGNSDPAFESLSPSILPTATVASTRSADIARLQNGKITLAGEFYPIAGVNYYPQAAPWTKFWPEYDPQQTTVDLQQVHALGLNTVRIFLSYVDFGGSEILPQRRAQLADFLGRANQAGLKVIVTIFDHHTDHHPSTWAADARHLATLIPDFAAHPAILAWDIKNEPDRDYGYNSQPLVDAWLRFVARHVRQHDPNHLITIGWSTPEAAVALVDVVDFVTFHYFDQPAAYLSRVTALQAQLGNKPLLLEEFTFSTWNSPFFPGHTAAEQANYYAAMLTHHQTIDSLGYLVWTLYDFDEVPLAEFGYPWQRGAQANMGIIRRDGRFKPAASLVAPTAERSPLPLSFWHHFTKPFWLVLVSLLIFIPLRIGLWWQRLRHR